jgi:putative adhesin
MPRARLLRAAVPAVLAAVLAAAPLAAQTPIRSARATAPGGVSLRIQNLEGSVRVVGWDQDSIAVTVEGITRRAFYFAGDAGGRGFKMGVETDADGRPVGPARLEVRVPRASRVWVKSNGASIEVDGVRGGLDLYSVSGPVRAAGRVEQLSVESMDGAVEITATAGWLKVKTADGRVLLQGAADDADVSTVSGPVVIEGGRYTRARFESVTGGIEFRGALPPDGDFSFETHSGPVTLRLDPEPDATVTVTTFGGDVRSAFGAPASGALRLGDGEATVAIRTFRGPIVLARR